MFLCNVCFIFTNISVSKSLKSLIIHDINDKVIPISRSKNVHKNWAVSKFMEVEGTGHFRILRTKEVINSVIN
mgnify:CR=1 FL=1